MTNKTLSKPISNEILSSWATYKKKRKETNDLKVKF